jgi:RNA polymerase sigma-54 factor
LARTSGVAARSIQECLLIQLKADPNPDPVSVEIVEEHFDELSRRRYPDIARALKLSLDRIMESVEEIMGLEPKPGRRFGGSDSRYIVPDVVVHKMGGEYVVVLNEDGVPRLRVNSLYRSLLRTAGSEAREYVEQKLSPVVAHQECGPAPAHAAQGHAIDREVPARVPGQGAAVPAPAVAARRG